MIPRRCEGCSGALDRPSPRAKFCVPCSKKRANEAAYRWQKRNPDRFRVMGTARAKRWRAANPEEAKRRQKAVMLKAKYGITLAQFNALMTAQNSCCAICGTPFASLNSKQVHVDHSHKTGKVRSILCHHCNTGLGAFREQTVLLRKAITYLRHA